MITSEEAKAALAKAGEEGIGEVTATPPSASGDSSKDHKSDDEADDDEEGYSF